MCVGVGSSNHNYKGMWHWIVW